MRKVREESRKLGNTRKKANFQDQKYQEEGNLEVRQKPQPVPRTAKALRGKRLLRAAETENSLIQDRSSKLEIIG